MTDPISHSQKSPATDSKGSTPDSVHHQDSKSTSTGSRPLASRKLSKWLQGANRPLYLVDSKYRLRFASEGLASFLAISSSDLNGLDCSRFVSSDVTRLSTIASLLAITSHDERSGTRLIPLALDAFRPLLPALHPSITANASHKDLPAEPINDWSSAVVVPLGYDLKPEGYICVWITKEEHKYFESLVPADLELTDAMRSAVLEARREFGRIEGLLAVIGNSPDSKRVRHQIAAAINGNMSVIISGPTGSEKGAIARAIYNLRRKRDKKLTSQGRLLPVRCSLMDKSLMTSMIEMAEEDAGPNRSDGNPELPVLLLEGIEQLAPDSHETLAAYLTRSPNVSCIATTRIERLMDAFPHSRAWKEIISFLEIMTIRITPLVNRTEDIPLLVSMICDEVRNASDTRTRKGWSQPAMIALQAFPWPDNLRQLRETIRLTLEATSSQTIDVADLPVAIRTFPSHVIQDHAIPEMFLDKAIEDFERHLIQAAVKAFPRNRAKAARYLNISRTRLLRRIEQLKIEVDESQVPDFDVFLRSSKDLTNSLEYQSDITNRVKEKTTSKKQDDTTSSFETHEPIDFKELPHDSE